MPTTAASINARGRGKAREPTQLMHPRTAVPLRCVQQATIAPPQASDVLAVGDAAKMRTRPTPPPSRCMTVDTASASQVT